MHAYICIVGHGQSIRRQIKANTFIPGIPPLTSANSFVSNRTSRQLSPLTFHYTEAVFAADAKPEISSHFSRIKYRYIVALLFMLFLLL